MLKRFFLFTCKKNDHFFSINDFRRSIQRKYEKLGETQYKKYEVFFDKIMKDVLKGTYLF